MKPSPQHTHLLRNGLISLSLAFAVTITFWITRNRELNDWWQDSAPSGRVDLSGSPASPQAESSWTPRMGMHDKKGQLTVQRDLTTREQALASSFSSDRKDGKEAEGVVEAFFPDLYRLRLIQSKAIRSAEDLAFQTNYLSSTEFLNDLRSILTDQGDFHLSNVGEYARLYAMESLKKALALENQPLREEFAQILLQTLASFPEQALGMTAIKNSLVVDRIQSYGLIKRYFPERLQQLQSETLHPMSRKVIEAVQQKPDQYRYLMGIES
jgi:hypothetical protein